MASPYLDPKMSGSLEQATGYLNQQAKARGRGPLSQDELNTIGTQVNYTPGGPVTGAQVNSAINYLGWGQQNQQGQGPSPGPSYQPPPAQGAPPPQPAPQAVPPPDQAGINRFQGWAQQTFGRQATPEELQQIATDPRVGYGGGTMTPQQEQAAQVVAREMAQRMGWAPAAPATPTMEQRVESGIGQILDQPIGFNPDDPVFKGQTAAFQRANQRDASRRRAEAAERAAARGTLNAGGFDVDVERISSEQGQKEAAFESQLAAQELQNQRNQIMRALELGAGRLSDTERNELAQRLAQLDAALRLKGLDLQAQGINQNNQQFYDSLGANIGLNQAKLNQSAILALINPPPRV